MSLTLGLTGMDPATEAALKSAFDDANGRLQGRWRLAPEGDADHVIVDMDSMYGPMSWLRLHAAGKHVIGLTSAARTQTDFRLGRPFDGHQMARLLEDVAHLDGVALTAAAETADVNAAGEHGAAPDTHTAEPRATPAPRAESTEPRSLAAEPAREVPAPQPGTGEDAGTSRDLLQGAEAAPGDGNTMPPSKTPEAIADDSEVPAYSEPTPALPVALQHGATVVDTQPADARASAPPPPAAEPAPATPEAMPRDTVFADWLLPGALSRRVRYRRESGPTLLIDPVAQVWHGPTPLKPVTAYFEGPVSAADFEAIDDATWAVEHAAAGVAQPLSRLRWLGGLVAGRGRLLPGLDPDGRYVLTRWPQTEREYPKHFRIATAMMKGPSQLAEIAAASGLAESEVADFINANLATGFAEFVPEPPPAVDEPRRPTGLLGRLRSR